YQGDFSGEPSIETKSEAPLSHDRYAIWELEAEHLMPHDPLDQTYGTTCPPFRTYDRDFYQQEYHPPFVPTSGPAFSSDNAGDGPIPMDLFADSQETIPTGTVRYEYLPVLVVVHDSTSEWSGMDDEDEQTEIYLQYSRWCRFPSEHMHEFRRDVLRLPSEEAWFDFLDGTPQWHDLAWRGVVHNADESMNHWTLGGPQPGDVNMDIFYMHVDDIPEGVLRNVDLSALTSDDLLIQEVYYFRAGPGDWVDDSAEAPYDVSDLIDEHQCAPAA
ncbi:MAG: hypothetical protein LC687_03760, partial [Actinobacteria bacterium]|nr:hypothetical protein [Actinomycetota bacterium]